MAAVSAPKPGIGAKMYRNTGTYASPTWAEVDAVLNCTLTLNWNFAEAGSRATRAMIQQKTRFDHTVTCDMRADDADTDYAAFRTAALSPTSSLDLLVLDGALTTEGVRGFRAHYQVNLTSQPQEADGSIYDQFELKPAPNADSAGVAGVVVGTNSNFTETQL